MSAADTPSSVDVPLVVNGANNGEIHTLPCAAVTKLPDIILSATKSMIGSMTMTGIRGLAGTSWTVGNSGSDGPLMSIAGTGGSITPISGTFSPSDIITQPYVGTLSSVTGYTAFDTETGWTISFDLQTERREVDALGTLDIKFKSIALMARCIPIGPSAANILATAKVQGSGAQRGRSFATTATQLQITGANGINYLTIPATAVKTAGYRFGAISLRNDEVGFVAARTFSAGVQQPLYTVAIS